MIFLTVLLNIIALAMAIRVPIVWPETVQKVSSNLQRQRENTHTSSVHRDKHQVTNHSQGKNDLYLPKYHLPTTDDVYSYSYIENVKPTSGSYAKSSAINNKKTQQNENYNTYQPSVRYSVPLVVSNTPTIYPKYAKDPIDFFNAKTNLPPYMLPKNNSVSQPISNKYLVSHDFINKADGWIPTVGSNGNHNVNKDQKTIHSIRTTKQTLDPSLVNRKVHRQHSDSSLNRGNFEGIIMKTHEPPFKLNNQQVLIDLKTKQKAGQKLLPNRISYYEHPNGDQNYVNLEDRNIKSHRSSIKLNNGEVLENFNKNQPEAEEKPLANRITQHHYPTNYKKYRTIEGRNAKSRDRNIKPKIAENLVKLNRSEEENNENMGKERPHGYETFQKVATEYDRQKNKFQQKLKNFPNSHNVDDNHETSSNIREDVEEKEEIEEQNEDIGGEEEETHFVPLRMIAQVRKSENEEHLPSSLVDARLREVIKDSKIHTVYTEEGYEDVGYDHGGHEKNAEDNEDQAGFNKKHLNYKFPKIPIVKNVNVVEEFEDFEDPSKNKFDSLENEETADDVEVSASTYENAIRPKNMKMKVFEKTKENVTTEIKNTHDGGMELEITSQFKVMTLPNNKSTSQAFVKIIPKKTNSQVRNKRFVNNTISINVIDKEGNSRKYPYYTAKTVINENSPLRYAENLRNIPEKLPGRLSFYEQARIHECPDIPDDIDPLPEEEPPSTGEKFKQPEDLDLPRVRNLGDKITCLKSKLFGENPLDSPIFRENIIKQPSPIFSELLSLSNLAKVSNRGTFNQKQQNKQENLVEAEKENLGEIEEKMEIDEIDEIEEATESYKNNDFGIGQNSGNDAQNSTSSAEKLTSDDQNYFEPILNITSLIKTIHSQVLPVGSNAATNKTDTLTSEASFQDQIGQTTEKLNSSTPISTNNNRYGKNMQISDRSDLNYDNMPIIRAFALLGQNLINEHKRNPKAINLSSALDVTPSNLISNKEIDPAENLPESLPFRIRRRRRKRPTKPYVQVFDVNSYLPTPVPPSSSTILPKYKTISEVYYKDDIKPNEQLNVFTDIINNIKNSPRDVIDAQVSENQPVEETLVVEEAVNNNRNKVNVFLSPGNEGYRRKIEYKNHKPFNSQEIDNSKIIVSQRDDSDKNKFNHNLQIKTFTTQSVVQHDLSIPKPVDDYSVDLFPPYPPNLQNAPLVIQKAHPVAVQKPYSMVTQQIRPMVVQQPHPMVIHKPHPTNPIILNMYFVEGMKPPLPAKPILYSDFNIAQHPNRIRRQNNYHVIRKRSPYKPPYLEIKRNQPTAVTTEEEDDYEPKRNRNFHYDVVNRKVVYLNKSNDNKEEQEDNYENEEYLTIEEPEITKSKYIVVTTERNGPSFLDYIQQLKNDSKYEVILDPKKNVSDATEDLKEIETTTINDLNRSIPQFLNILSKIKSSDGYVNIKDEEKQTTTIASPKIKQNQEVEEGEELVEDVENFPKSVKAVNSYKIFDITEYLPQIEDYTPKTVIDYSKYKTIQRSTALPRHNLSSRYNSEEEEHAFSKTESTVSPNEYHRRRSGYGSSEEIITEEIPVTSTTTEATTTRIKLVRNRQRKRPTTTTEKPTTSKATTRRMRMRSRPTTAATTTTTTTTTTTEYNLEENYSQTQRIVQRRFPVDKKSRQNPQIPRNHKPVYTPIITRDRGPSSRFTVPNRTPLPYLNKKRLNAEETQPNKVADVQVFTLYDPNRRHGGNYRREETNNAPPINLSTPTAPAAKPAYGHNESKELTYIVPQPFGFNPFSQNVHHPKDLKERESGVLDNTKLEYLPKIQERKDDVVEEDEVIINFDNNSSKFNNNFQYNESERAIKKTVTFVRDPSKRLYYYAPVK